ncbi:uncharacterized protein LOC143017984 [Oratosquilla oratoria]|uniref:uncharacterized protein LOC143017984 n=1 Tax=Oratosquilla oratoria TaxID=337810 RepID=UPI003F76C02A
MAPITATPTAPESSPTVSDATMRPTPTTTAHRAALVQTSSVSNITLPQELEAEPVPVLIETTQIVADTALIRRAVQSTVARPVFTGRLRENGKSCISQIFIDCGAQRTFVHPSVVDQLKLQPKGTVLFKIDSFNKTELPQVFDIVEFNLHVGAEKHRIEAVVHPAVGKNMSMPGYQRTVQVLQSQGITIANETPSDQTTDIHIILGSDHMPLVFKRAMRFLGGELFATSAGYVVWGKLPPWSQDRALNPPIETTALNSIRIDEPVLVDPPVHELWSLDSVGISLEKYSHLEEKAVKFFKSTVRKGNGAYTIRLPFKTEERPAINYGRAVAQLHSLKRNPHPSLYSDYRNILEEYLRLGFIETVPPGPEVDGKVHYLPHHPVYKNSSTTPVRIVFNASSRAHKNALSLNDALYTGPNLAQKIQSMILLFREGTYGVLADISKAFLRIGVDEADRDFCRFLFFTSADMREIQAFRFKVVLFGATCSPYLLNQTIEHHLETYDQDRILRG